MPRFMIAIDYLCAGLCYAVVAIIALLILYVAHEFYLDHYE